MGGVVGSGKLACTAGGLTACAPEPASPAVSALPAWPPASSARGLTAWPAGVFSTGWGCSAPAAWPSSAARACKVRLKIYTDPYATACTLGRRRTMPPMPASCRRRRRRSASLLCTWKTLPTRTTAAACPY